MSDRCDYTTWWAGTGEIAGDGSALRDGCVYIEDGQKIYWGAKVSDETHVFDIVTELPILRETPRLKTAHELNGRINRERARRIEAGKDFEGVMVTGSDKDISNLTNLALGAQLRIGLGDTTTVTVFRDGNNVDHELLPAQLIGLWQAASQYVSAIYQASWVLKDTTPTPADYSNDNYWPEA